MHQLKPVRRMMKHGLFMKMTVSFSLPWVFSKGISINGWKLHAQNAGLREAARFEATRSSAAEGMPTCRSTSDQTSHPKHSQTL